MRSEKDTLADRLVQRLKLLVLFHLGADATSIFNITPTGLEASIKHSRIEPFDFQIASEEFTDIAANPEKIEELFLDLLVKNRRG
jgi:hypothetical protein